MSNHYDPTQPSFSRALEKVEPQLATLHPAELAPIRHDIPSAVWLVLGNLPKMLRHREEVRARIGEDAATTLDRLEDAAFAAGAANGEYLTSLHGGDVAAMLAELGQQKRVLLAEAEALVVRHKMAASKLAELAGGTGQKDLCFDVVQLVSAYRAEWASLSGHTVVTVAELDHAEALASAVAKTLSENEASASNGSVQAERRQRAYTHFVRTYEEVRRAIAYVRAGVGDADEIAPSLSSGRARRGAGDDVDPSNDVATPVTTTTTAPGTPAPVPGAPNASPFVATS